MKTSNKKAIKFFAIFASLLIIGYMTLNLVACRPEAPDLDTFNVGRGDIVETISSTGMVDSREMMNYAVLQAAEILEILKKGDTFKKGETIIKIDNSRTELLIKQAEQNLVLAEQAIDVARINYQSALDANHVAIQIAESSNNLAEQSTQDAYKAMENANILADASINSAYVAIQNANDYLNAVKNDPIASNSIKAQAEGNVKSAEAAYEQAKESARSQSGAAESGFEQSLYNQSITYWNNINNQQQAQAQINLMKKNIAQAETQLELARLNIELAELDSDTFIMAAAFDGIVLAANFSKGEYASPGIAALTVISDEFVIKSDINETDIAKIEIGQNAEITFDAYPAMSFNGTISEISPISKNIAGIVTFEITITPDAEAEDYLKHGLSANTEILISETRDILYIPVQAVYEEDGKEYVDILTEDNQIKKVEITSGNYNYDYIEIKSGLSEGDTVILTRIDEQLLEENSGPGFFTFGRE